MQCLFFLNYKKIYPIFPKIEILSFPKTASVWFAIQRLFLFWYSGTYINDGFKICKI